MQSIEWVQLQSIGCDDTTIKLLKVYSTEYWPAQKVLGGCNMRAYLLVLYQKKVFEVFSADHWEIQKVLSVYNVRTPAEYWL